MHYYIYRESDNELISDSADVIAPKSGYTVISFEERQAGTWNKETLSFDPHPDIKRYTKHDFYEKVGTPKFGKVVIASKTNVEVEIFLRFMEGMATIRLDNANLLSGVNCLVHFDVWTQAEADEVLNG